MLCVPGYGKLVFSFGMRCAECTFFSLPAAVHVSACDVVEFPYCADCGTWDLPFDAFRHPVRGFAWSCLLDAST